MEIQDKKIIITGAGSGIGAAMLHLLLRYEGIEVVAADLRDSNSYDDNDAVHWYLGDIADPNGLDALFEFALQKMGRIDLFIANAGFAYYEKTLREDWLHINKIYACNTFSPIYCAHKMARINQDREYGVLITASFMGIFSLPGYSLYGSTKAALLSWADAYRLEKQDRGHIMMLCPVATRTNFFKTTAPVPWPTQEADVVAKAAIAGIIKNQKRVFPSKLSSFILFLNRLFPLSMSLYQIGELRKLKAWLKGKSD